MAKEATKLNMQIERYCPAVHKNTCKRTLQYAEVEKQIAEKSNFVIIFLSFFLSIFLSFFLSYYTYWFSICKCC